jgi:hypothetical protein
MPIVNAHDAQFNNNTDSIESQHSSFSLPFIAHLIKQLSFQNHSNQFEINGCFPCLGVVALFA